MSDWTRGAIEEWDRYTERVRASVAPSGVDVDELVADLRMHVDEELRDVDVVTEEHVRAAIARIGPIGAAEVLVHEDGSPASTVSHTSVEVSRRPVKPPKLVPVLFGARLPMLGAMLFGVGLPTLAIFFELSTRVCAEHFVDPLPSGWHVLLFALIPVVNLWALCVRIADRAGRPGGVLTLLHGVATGVAIAYSIAFLPLLPFSLIGTLFLIGACGFAPYTGLLTLVLQRPAVDALVGERAVPAWKGIALGFLALALVELPTSLTRVGTYWAASDSQATRTRGLRLLRAFGDEDEMLRACYSRNRGATDLVGFALGITGSVDRAAARDTYYRVTGEPFNAKPPREEWRPRGEFLPFGDWDADLGGDEVGGVVRHLALVESSLDGSVDPRGALGYLEWTLRFENSGSAQREARTLIRLPPGGVVSRVTLWVNGEAREAVFAGRAQAREAYQSVVRVRRDPILVTTSGPDQVLAQCFPVPPGGAMKVRLGITAPLVLIADQGPTFVLPKMIERNFAVDGSEHHVWFESSARLRSDAVGLAAESVGDGGFALRGTLRDRALLESSAIVVDAEVEAGQVAWSRDPVEDRWVRQALELRPEPPPSHVAIVVDGSALMAGAFDEIADAIGALSPAVDKTIVLAGDVARQVGVEELRDHAPAGGCDNGPALLRAWDVAAMEPGGVVLWIHGPQPVTMRGALGLSQRLHRRPDGPRLLDFPAVLGRNRITEEIEGTAALESVTRVGGVGEDLRRLFDGWSLGEPALVAARAWSDDEDADENVHDVRSPRQTLRPRADRKCPRARGR